MLSIVGTHTIACIYQLNHLAKNQVISYLTQLKDNKKKIHIGGKP